MIKYIALRLSHAIPVLFGITLIAFLLGVIMPGDPAEMALSAGGTHVYTEEQLAVQRQKMGLDKPPHLQYIHWMNNALHGNLGISYRTKAPVSEEIGAKIPITLALSFGSLLLTIAVGVPIGVISALYKNKFFDTINQFFSIVYVSVPSFWVALILINIFSERLKWLPTSGQGGFKYLILPMIALSLSTIGSTIRLVRSSILKEISAQYVVVAHSKGLSKAAVYIHHAFRNSLIPVIALLGSHFGGILGGSIIIETIFAINGIGKFAIDSIALRDYPALQGYVLVTGVVFVCTNLLVDVAYYFCNPQIKLGGVS